MMDTSLEVEMKRKLATPGLALLLGGLCCCAAKEKTSGAPPLSVSKSPEEKTSEEKAEHRPGTTSAHKPVSQAVARTPTAPAPSPAPGKSPPDTESQRAGALRLPAVWPTQLSVSYQPDPALSWPQMARALAGRRAQTSLRPFDSLGTAAAEGEVAHSGEILALALARQLSLLGWDVLIDGFSIAIQSDVTAKKQKGGRGADGGVVRIEVSGKGSFTVSPAAETVARVKSRVSFRVAARKPAVATVDVTERVSESMEPVRSRRMELAKKKAVASFITKLFRSPHLEPSLAKAVRQVR